MRLFLSSLCLLALTAASGVASADVIDPSQAECRGKKLGDACSLMGDPSEGTCQTGRCCRNDYSQGVPPKTVCSDCLKCQAGKPAAPAEGDKPAPDGAAPTPAAPTAAPTAEKPAAEKAAEKPAAEKPAAEKPAAEKPAEKSAEKVAEKTSDGGCSVGGQSQTGWALLGGLLLGGVIRRRRR